MQTQIHVMGCEVVEPNKSCFDDTPRRVLPVREDVPWQLNVVWPVALALLTLHVASVYGLYVLLVHSSLYTFIWGYLYGYVGGEGITLGAHRLYAHRSYKAGALYRLVINLIQASTGQHTMYTWVRDHRMHHKYSDTDADPHNSRRGFFFSHVGWLMVRKHPEVVRLGKQLDMSDIEADSIVMFQKKYYLLLYAVLGVIIPVGVPCWLWGETFHNSFFVAYVLRTVLNFNFTWLVNSAAHKFGTRPYTRDIVAVESPLVSMVTLGEGWHNYHHTFPWDYRASEYGQRYNLTTDLLDLFRRWGWVYDLRAATPAMVQHRVLKRGDGSHRE